MNRLSISEFKSTGLHPSFNVKMAYLEMPDKAFDSGGYGEVYKCTVNNVVQAVKIFTNAGNKGYDTICKLQDVVIDYNQKLKNEGKTPIERMNALGALPLFSFKGQLKGASVVGYSTNWLDNQKWTNFYDLFSEEKTLQERKDLRNVFYNLPFDSRMKILSDLLEGFVAFQDMKFVYADLNPQNFFINIHEHKLCLIDYDSGGLDGIAETIGKDDAWLAPELKRKEQTTANLFTDYWSIAMTVHHFFFPLPPFFYLKGQSKKLMKEYFDKYQYPNINTKDINFNKKMEQIYSQYVMNLKKLPSEIPLTFNKSFQNGYFKSGARITSQQWFNVIQSLLSPNSIKTRPIFNSSNQPTKSSQQAQSLQPLQQTPPPRQPTYLYTNQSNVNFDAIGAAETVNVTTDAKSYDVLNLPKWCSVANKTALSFQIVCKPNSTKTARNQTITVKSCDFEALIVLEQEAAVLNLSLQTLDLDAKSASKTVYVTTNCGTFTVIDSPPWCPVTQSPNSVKIECHPNKTKETRDGRVTVRAGGIEEYITVKQEGRKHIWWIPILITLIVVGLVFGVYKMIGQFPEKVDVEPPIVLPNNISLNPPHLSLSVRQSGTLSAIVSPDDSDKSVDWFTNNQSVATVNNNGVVTAVGAGTAVITARSVSNSNISATATVVVNEIDVPPTIAVSLSPTSLTLHVGNRGQLTANVQPANAPNRAVEWSSSDTNVATVNNGVVIAVSRGNAVITARSTADRSKTATCNVTVTPDVGTINYSFGSYNGERQNGIPHGQGTMRYTCRIQIARHGRATVHADNGDVLTGTWANGDIVNGNLNDRNGNQKAAILAGRRQSPHNLNNDRCE